MPKYKSVKLLEETYEKLDKLKHIGQSFDGIIQEIIEELRRKKK